MKLKNTCLLLLFPVLSFCQTRLGAVLNGSVPEEQFGRTVILSADGNTLAVAAPFSPLKGEKTGYVRMYHWENGNWQQTGADIPGAACDDRFGEIMALSGDGKTLAVTVGYDAKADAGLIKVYRLKDNNWALQTAINIADMPGKASYETLNEVSLSADGNILAAGTELNDYGRVKIFRFNGNSWTAKPELISTDNIREDYNSHFGESISLSADGNIMAIGARSKSLDKVKGAGQVKVYQYSEGKWNALGNEINGKTDKEYLGKEVKLSADGKVLAVSSSSLDLFNANTGFVRVYTLTDGEWKQTGKDLRPEGRSSNWYGESIALSADGSIVAASMVYVRYGEPGYVQLYKNKNDQWKILGKAIDEKISEEKTKPANNTTGWSISISADGKRVAVGYPHNDPDGKDIAGQVVVYELSE